MVRTLFAFASLVSIFYHPGSNASFDYCKAELIGGLNSRTQLTRRLSDLVLRTDLTNLSDREKTLFAKSIDYLQNHKAQLAIELAALGAPTAEIIELMRPVVAADLRLLEAEQVLPQIRHAKPQIDRAWPATRGLRTLKDFGERYNLSAERALISTMNLSGSFAHGGPTSDDVLKAALFTGDSDLIDRALRSALRFGKFSELTAIASSAGRSSLLLGLGRLSIARYLYFDRNHNWLGDALNSFAELTGPEWDQAVDMLRDLNDLMRSPAI